MPVPEIPCQEPKELLDVLRGWVSTPRQVVYRGLADATWQLTPKAFRKDPPTRFPTRRGMETLDEFMRTEPAAGPPEKVNEKLEHETLVRFFDAADTVGLQLPEDSQIIRAVLHDTVYGGHGWPDRSLWSLLALAQHHGLPTRLLDWTWDWRVAAFFAARELLSRKDRPAKLAVWVLAADVLTTENRIKSLGPVPPTAGKNLHPVLLDRLSLPYTLHLVTAPGATNLYLRAQNGLFTLLKPKPDASLTVDTPLDELKGADELLTKHTLPSEKATELLHLLACEGVTSAAICPDFTGVVRSIRERSLWPGGNGQTE